jgi:hypothetical protein
MALKVSWRFKGARSYENVVIRSPVRPKDAVQAGNRQLAILTTKMIAKQSQKDSPIEPPTVPALRVATAILALSLRQSRQTNSPLEIKEAYQKVQAFQTLVVFCCLSSSVTRCIPFVSIDNFFTHARKPFGEATLHSSGDPNSTS